MGQKNYVTSRDKKIRQPLGTNKITQPLGGWGGIMQPLGATKKSHNLLGQQKYPQPLGTKKNTQHLGTKNHAAPQENKSRNLSGQKNIP